MSALPRLELGPAILSRIRGHAEAGYPEEVCGGLLGERRADGVVEIRDALPLANARERERRRRYLIGPDDVLACERRAARVGLEVVGFYHSHPDAAAAPSEFDRENAWPSYIYLIVSVGNGHAKDAAAWRLADDRSSFSRVKMVKKEEMEEAGEP